MQSEQDMICGYCLFCIRSGLGVWCCENESYTKISNPICNKFIPNTELIEAHQKQFGREGQ